MKLIPGGGEGEKIIQYAFMIGEDQIGFADVNPDGVINIILSCMDFDVETVYVKMDGDHSVLVNVKDIVPRRNVVHRDHDPRREDETSP